MLTDLALAPMRQVDAAGLIHDVTLETEVRVRTPGAKYTSTWVSEAEQPCRLNPASQGGQNIRADQPTAAGDWVLSLVSGATVIAGQRALVRGATGGIQWQEFLSIVKVLHPRSHELRRRCLCVDVELSA